MKYTDLSKFEINANYINILNLYTNESLVNYCFLSFYNQVDVQ